MKEVKAGIACNGGRKPLAFRLLRAALFLVLGIAGIPRAQDLQTARETGEPFDYSLYAVVLQRFVDEAGLVDYAELSRHRETLDRFITRLAAVDTARLERAGDSDRIAFWINAYNALTLRVVIDHYPIKAGFLRSLVYPANSIRQIPGVWDEIRFPVAGRERTLDEIEHRILRRDFREPRIHFALVCASLGCPVLRREPYEGPRLDAQLDDQVRRFLADPSKFQWEEENQVLRISPIFRWFEADFAPSCRGNAAGRAPVICFLRRYLPPERSGLLDSPQLRIEYLDYDWRLNDRGAPPR
ncbi:MAG: DUF547 domain-containing protein [Acidobacteriota bacterium]